MKKYLKNQAIELRQKGLSYSEILEKIKVSKSTLSLWLRSVDLAKKQKQRLTLKKLAAAMRGANKRKSQRIENEIRIKNESEQEIRKIDNNNLFLIGIALYWAEGSKKSGNRSGHGVVFSNSDPKMIRVYLKWLKECLNIDFSDIWFELYIHENRVNEKLIFINYWANFLNVDKKNFSRIYIKKNKTIPKKNDCYFGLMRVGVRRSTNLNRKIAGWINGVYKNTAGSSNGRTPLFGSGYSRFDS